MTNEKAEDSHNSTEIDLHHVAAADEIGEGDRRILEIEGREVAVFNIDSTYHAILNYCTHQSGPVCEGMIHGIIDIDSDDELIYSDEGYLSCPWHGWTFDVKTGEHTGGTDHRLVKYETTVQDGDVYVVRRRRSK